MDETATSALRDHFLGWQCRIRQIAMRQDQGRPSAGMRPRLLDRAGRELSPAVTVLLVPAEPAESTTFFRFQAQRTHDPRLVYEKGLEYLQSTHFQHPRAFSDEMTALFGVGSALAKDLIAAGTCRLDFAQFSQSFRIPCAVRALTPREPAFEATFWHNRMFNPALPGRVTILGLRPDWQASEAEPPV